MNIDTTALEDIGFTNAQIKTYVILMELGESKTGEIIKKTKLHSSVVYNALSNLIEQGLVSFILKGKIKYFYATDPENLLKVIEDKKSKITEMIPKLIIKRKLIKQKQEAQVFLGWKGIYAAFNKILEVLPKNSEYIAFGAGIEEQYKQEVIKFFREFQKKRALKHYKVKLIGNEKIRKQIENYKYYPKFGKPDFRFVPGFAPIGIIIFGDNILNVAFEEKPIAVIITSKQIADSYRKSFYSMWKIAKE